MTVTCTRRISFCAGHRVFGHESKCATPHGHQYEVMITAAGTLDGIGRVIDFSVLKQKVGGWIDTNWDHTFIVYEKDERLLAALRSVPDTYKGVFVAPFNPTAEELAKYLLSMICPTVLLGTGVAVTEVVVWETPNCHATARLK